jgi:hypothetical protein
MIFTPLFCLLFFISCATPVDFMPVSMKKPESAFEITNIEDYENLVKRNKIKTVFVTDEYFIVEINSIVYILQTRGYKNFHDYREGKLSTPEEWPIFIPGYSLDRQ